MRGFPTASRLADAGSRWISNAHQRRGSFCSPPLLAWPWPPRGGFQARATGSRHREGISVSLRRHRRDSPTSVQLAAPAQRDPHDCAVATPKDLYERMNVEVPTEIAEIGDMLQAVNENASLPPIDQVTESSHAGNAVPGCHDNNAMEDNEANTNME